MRLMPPLGECCQRVLSEVAVGPEPGEPTIGNDIEPKVCHLAGLVDDKPMHGVGLNPGPPQDRMPSQIVIFR